jgi:methylated-DNA-[protein]-cysteine S-methyltransferase
MADILRLWVDEIATPLGQMLVAADKDGCLRATFWTEKDRELRMALGRLYPGLTIDVERATDPHGLSTAMRAYFDGDVRIIDTILVASGGTAFQRDVWRALRDIPCGTTISYGELARRIHRPDAVRAVGAANGANPIGVVVPCHRVIGANGSLTGYGGGMERKRWLLDHERQLRL